jgi:hypothetical protein
MHQLREYRNLLTHDGAGVEEQESRALLYQLNRMVCAVIGMLGLNRLGLSSSKEVVQFLDAPKERETLRARIDIFEKVLKFRTSTDGGTPS